ncbi:unnamed protein product [Owenia fusiformis]|uniref:Poly [ADP-ribose] polymerase n=1 Tax=Owenia fusiformis TaxID=6347 RepID=A0A8S4Q1A7_OWEFU|nr:unnamed protein product [Owenia fusiformis]
MQPRSPRVGARLSCRVASGLIICRKVTCTMGVFTGCQIVLDVSTAVRYKEKQSLKKLVTDNDGIISFILTNKSSCVVADSNDQALNSYKCRTALDRGIPIVSTAFLKQSVEQEKLQDFDLYLLAGKTKAEELSTGKIVANKNQSNVKKKRKTEYFDIKKIKVWPSDDKDQPFFDETDYTIVKHVFLRKYDKKNSTEKFCIIELHSYSRGQNAVDSQYRVSLQSGSFHLGTNIELPTDVNTEYRYCSTPEIAIHTYAHLYNKFTKLPEGMTRMYNSTVPAHWKHLGSTRLQRLRSELGVWNSELPSDVSELVDHIWKEASGVLDEVLGIPVESIKVDQVEKAEGLLLQLKLGIVKESESADISSLSNEFYDCIPHQPDHKIEINSKRLIAKKQDLCQLIRDMIAMSEATNWKKTDSISAKYRALRCNIESTDATEAKDITDLFYLRFEEFDCKAKVKNVFKIRRAPEEDNFTHNISNKKLLFHASIPHNFVGILSRGLLLPNVIVDDYGGTRTDAGMLGSGIYFALSSSTSAKYSSPSANKGTRFLLVNEVALGKCKEYVTFHTELKAPPSGYDSTHGVKGKDEYPTDFKDDEYVIYNPQQQRIKYLIEFSLPEDTVKEQPLAAVTWGTDVPTDVDMDDENDDSEPNKDIGLDDIKNISDPMDNVQAGLQSDGEAPVPLQSVHIRAELVDLAAKVVVLQEYRNESNVPIEAKYVFPLNDMCAVVGFEAFINGKHIIGEVKEKEVAHKEYKKAISEGHGAYLMDQDVETPDVFTVSVGNLPAQASVLIKITYVAELQVEGDNICFTLPGSVAPWKKETALDEKTQSDVHTVKVDKDESDYVTVQVSVRMPFNIHTLHCPTHKVKMKQTADKAVVELQKNQQLGEGFTLLIGLAEIHVPRMWVEEHPDKDSQACMLTFYPEFEAVSDESYEIIFMLDVSNSMKGAALLDARKILLLTLQHLPQGSSFNVVLFGTGFEELFPCSVQNTKANMKLAQEFIKNAKADQGNTEASRPLQTYLLLAPTENIRNIMLLSDGHINNSDSTLHALKCNCKHTRLFSMGVSGTANKHMLRALASAGAGAFEFFDSKRKSKSENKIKSQLSKAGQPGLTSVSIDWEQHDDNGRYAKPLQAPSQISSLFSGSRQVVYGFVPNCLMATLHAEIDGHEVSTMVSTSDLSVTHGTLLHQLTARGVIRDWEEGTLALQRTEHEAEKMKRKKQIINLSVEYSIVTQFTSFVAVEKRDKDEDMTKSEGPSIEELVAEENVDILDYIAWKDSGDTHERPQRSTEERVIDLAAQAKKEEECDYVSQALRSYEEAIELAEKDLPPTHPLCLSTKLNLSVFYDDVMKDKDKAYATSKEAFDNAISELDCLSEESYGESTRIMQLLRDNITLWGSEIKPLHEPGQVELYAALPPSYSPTSPSYSPTSASYEYSADMMLCEEAYEDCGTSEPQELSDMSMCDDEKEVEKYIIARSYMISECPDKSESEEDEDMGFGFFDDDDEVCSSKAMPERKKPMDLDDVYNESDDMCLQMFAPTQEIVHAQELPKLKMASEELIPAENMSKQSPEKSSAGIVHRKIFGMAESKSMEKPLPPQQNLAQRDSLSVLEERACDLLQTAATFGAPSGRGRSKMPFKSKPGLSAQMMKEAEPQISFAKSIPMAKPAQVMQPMQQQRQIIAPARAFGSLSSNKAIPSDGIGVESSHVRFESAALDDSRRLNEKSEYLSFSNEPVQFGFGSAQVNLLDRSAPPPSPPPMTGGGLFGGPVSSAFGSASPAAPPPVMGGGLFGGPTSHTFGTVPPPAPPSVAGKGLFGSPVSSAFGSAPPAASPPAAGGGLFGGPTSRAFGSAPPPPPPPVTGGGLFGGPVSSAFGSAPPAASPPAAGGGLFGGPTSRAFGSAPPPPPPPVTGGGLFGGPISSAFGSAPPAASPPAAGGGLFGGPTSRVFGSAPPPLPPPMTGGVSFGSPSSNAFRSAPAPPPPTGLSFGSFGLESAPSPAADDGQLADSISFPSGSALPSKSGGPFSLRSAKRTSLAAKCNMAEKSSNADVLKGYQSKDLTMPPEVPSAPVAPPPLVPPRPSQTGTRGSSERIFSNKGINRADPRHIQLCAEPQPLMSCKARGSPSRMRERSLEKMSIDVIPVEEDTLMRSSDAFKSESYEEGAIENQKDAKLVRKKKKKAKLTMDTRPEADMKQEIDKTQPRRIADKKTRYDEAEEYGTLLENVNICIDSGHDIELDLFSSDPYQYDRQDSDGYHSGIGTPVPSLVSSDFHMNIEVIKQLVHLQTQEGFWELTEEIGALIGVSTLGIEDLLCSAGIRSLGNKVSTNMKRLLCSLLTVLRIMQYLRPELLDSISSKLKEIHTLQTYITEVINTLCTDMESNMPYIENVIKALMFIALVDKTYPLVYSTLELGHSWAEVGVKILGM